MCRPSGESKTTEQKSPVAREICSATMASRASMSGTASLKAPEADAIAARRPVSSMRGAAGPPESPLDTSQLYAGVRGISPSKGRGKAAAVDSRLDRYRRQLNLGDLFGRGAIEPRAQVVRSQGPLAPVLALQHP